jgi:ubiquinone/menaquinone biosynthesis C-methylase UbiE
MPGALYDQVGSAYDATRCADPYLTNRLLTHLAAPEHARVVDVACGTGNYTLALAGAGLSVTGVDASARMIAAASEKSGRTRIGPRLAGNERHGPAVPSWVVGDVTRLPFASSSFDGATCTLALRYFGALEQALMEVGRVVSSGPLVVFTATPVQIRRYWLREYFPQTVERVATQAYPLDRITTGLRAAGFGEIEVEPYSVRPDCEDLFLYSGKHRPELYLNPSVRAGMWSFAHLASPAEEVAGCAGLRRDIASGRIRTVIKDAIREESMASLRGGSSVGGDYVFVVARR